MASLSALLIIILAVTCKDIIMWTCPMSEICKHIGWLTSIDILPRPPVEAFLVLPSPLK